jgi:hypothetical protein
MSGVVTDATIPQRVRGLIDAAHKAHEAYRRGEGTLHDSSNATVEARNAVCGWVMDVIYRPDPEPVLSQMFDGTDNTAQASEFLREKAARREELRQQREAS